MDAMLIPVDGNPEEVEVNGLEDLQRLVGGCIDAFPVYDPRGWTVYVNDEGIARCMDGEPGCEPNRAIFADGAIAAEGYLSQMDGKPVSAGDLYAILCGPIVAIGFDAGEGADVSLTEGQKREVRSIFESGPSSAGSGMAALALVQLGIKVDASCGARAIG